MTQTLAQAQREMARFLRDPQGRAAPPGIEARRLQVYRDLVYRNIEGFISSAFPVLRGLYSDRAWEDLVRDFIQHHRCNTPLFLKISEEFLGYMAKREVPPERPFEAELAHYEWLELAVDVSPGKPAREQPDAQPHRHRARLAPTARLVAYAFPVHRIGASFQPRDSGATTHLLVYRGLNDSVQFMELNMATARLLRETNASPKDVATVIGSLAQEWAMQEPQLLSFAWQQLREFNVLGALSFVEG
ncbi:MAG: putative DNA-binding domain-containing protein [Pseudomonadota bacterium]